MKITKELQNILNISDEEKAHMDAYDQLFELRLRVRHTLVILPVKVFYYNKKDRLLEEDGLTAERREVKESVLL